MPLTESYFVQLLQLALRLDREGRFDEFSQQHGDIGDLILSDDGTFEALCASNDYVVFIHQLLDCWIDSKQHPYTDVPDEEWPEIGESLINDIRHQRIPSHPLWEFIWTLRCTQCGEWTKNIGSAFTCPKCNATMEFRIPKE